VIIRKETQKKPKIKYKLKKENLDSWEPTYEHCLWKSAVQNSVGCVDLENHLI
jgi:hypothetical protein